MTAQLSPLFSWRGQIAGSDLNSTSKLVAFTLSLHMSERGDSCFPSIDTLADETSLHHDTVKTHLAKLAAAGWISKTYDRSVKGRGTRVYYAAAIPSTGAETHPAPAETEQGGARPRSTGADDPPPYESVNEDVNESDETSSRAEAPTMAKAQRDALFQSIVSACGMEYGEMTKRQQRSCAVAMAELAAVQATPEEVHRRSLIYRQKFECALTPNALANQWAGLREPDTPMARAGGGVMDRVKARLAAEKSEPVPDNVVTLRAVGQ